MAIDFNNFKNCGDFKLVQYGKLHAARMELRMIYGLDYDKIKFITKDDIDSRIKSRSREPPVFEIDEFSNVRGNENA